MYPNIHFPGLTPSQLPSNNSTQEYQQKRPNPYGEEENSIGKRVKYSEPNHPPTGRVSFVSSTIFQRNPFNLNSPYLEQLEQPSYSSWLSSQNQNSYANSSNFSNAQPQLAAQFQTQPYIYSSGQNPAMQSQSLYANQKLIDLPKASQPFHSAVINPYVNALQASETPQSQKFFTSPTNVPQIPLKKTSSSSTLPPTILTQQPVQLPEEGKANGSKIIRPSLPFDFQMTDLNKDVNITTISTSQLESRIIQILQTKLDKFKLNALLIGPKGCGKTTLMANMARSLSLNYRHLGFSAMLSVDTVDIIKNLDPMSNYSDQVLINLQMLFYRTSQSNPGQRILISIDKLEDLFNLCNCKSIEVLLVAMLNKHPHIQLIVSTSPEQNQSLFSKQTLLMSYFQNVPMESMNKETTLQILKQKYEGKASSHFLEITFHLANRYFPQQANPLKTIILIEECLAILSMRTEMGAPTQEILWQVIADRTNIPIDQIQENANYSLEIFEKKLVQAVVGQDHILREVSEDILCFKGGWNNSQKPPMVYVFAGPTGVGKTELAKKIAEVVFGNAQKLVRLDMAEYFDQSARARLIGAPPSYIGYEEGGQLTNALEKHGSCVVLLDEIEKAHEEVLKIFLAVFDEGRMSSARGKEYNCKNVCFIMTTNLGTNEIQQRIQETSSFNIKQAKSSIESLIALKFGLEWLGRVKVLPFAPLTKEVCQKVITIHLQRLAQEFTDQKQIHFYWNAEVVEFLANNGFDPKMGARPLINFIDKTIRLAMAQIDGVQKFQPDSVVDCGLNEHGEIYVAKRKS